MFSFVSFASFVLGVVARKRSASHYYEPTSNPANLPTTRTSYVSVHSNADSTFGDNTYGALPSPPAHTPRDPTRPYAAAIPHHHQNPNYYD